MTKLSRIVETRGLSKDKLIVILGVLAIIVIGALLFGVFSSGNDNNKAIGVDDDLVKYPDNTNTTEQLLKKILDKKKISASSPVESNVVTKLAIIPPLQAVPPIVSTTTDDISEEDKLRDQYHKKELDKKYSSFSSKTLLFSKYPSTVQGGVTKEKPQSTVGANEANQADTSDSESNVTSNQFIINESIIKGEGNTPSQKEKHKFMQDTQNINSDYLSSVLQKPKSPYEIKAGSVIPAIMVNGLNSDLPGQIIALVRENVYDSATRKYLLIPQGARLVGLYDNNISYGQERILIAWNRLIYQDGSSINLKAMPGTDLEGYAGFYDEVDNKYWKIFGTSFIMGVITGAMQYSQNNTNANIQVGGVGITTTDTNPTVGQTLSGSLGQQLGQTGLSLAQKNLNVQPTLIIRPNYPFNVMITADMILRPVNS